jgi:glutamate dehydrogenase
LARAANRRRRTAERERHAILNRVAALARVRLGARRSRETIRFVRRFYAQVGVEDLRRRGPENLLGAASAMRDFAQTRKSRGAGIRIYDPDPKRDGWRSPATVIEIVNDDMPFLVDSLSAFFAERGIAIMLIVHPVLRVRRNKRGGLAEIVESKLAPARPKGTRTESLMQVEIEAQPAAAHAGLEQALGLVLADVRAVVADWRAMRARIDAALAEIAAVKPPLPPAEIAEAAAFLEWLRDKHFTFQGARSYTLQHARGRDFLRPVPKSGLGLLRKVSPESAARHRAPLPAALSAFARKHELLIIAKATARTPVHRSVPLDFIGIRRFSRQGRVIGQHRLVGLFTSLAYSQSPRYIPLLREKVARVIARAGFDPDSHDGKTLLHILETYPRDELFQASEDELYEAALGILQLQERRRVALFVRRDPFEWHVSCLVFVPRDRYSNEIKQRFQSILESAFAGTDTSCDIQVSDAPLARLHFVIRTVQGAIPDYDVRRIERDLVEAARSWRDRLAEALAGGAGQTPVRGALERYGGAFSPGYQDRFAAESAIFDIARIEEVLASNGIGVHLYRRHGAPEREVRLKLYRAAEPIDLSDILPVLEHMGFRVTTELPFEVKPKGVPHAVWLQELGMESDADRPVDPARLEPRFRDCFVRVFDGSIEDDGFNRLIAAAGLSWREVVVLRAYGRFLRQAGMPWSDAYVQATLSRNPGIASRLVRLFMTKFDADAKDSRGRVNSLAAEIEAALEAVANPDEDRILRRFFNLIAATVRTNYFQTLADGGPKPYLALKFESRRIDELPAPKPLYEMFVYSPEMEGVHLRGGRIARGGIRWSDRREDFRTEILGLMKAQTVKNAVIVPVGAKGGFVVKRPPPPGAPREAAAETGIACYRILVSGMLDVTDNLVRNRIVPPPRVVRHDGDDPYLVVAADKGTATFSDIANSLSRDRGFWLGDAFASGGSSGYDHKKLGITARGAWESVKRHFREMGRDAEREEITVVGVGDMSGDVFGNGMLLSKKLKLVAAFNHLHIFVDPDPDPSKSHAERARLFRLPRSSWADYREDAVSKGGGVFERRVKAIKLTPEMRARFDLTGDTVAPNALIRALLRSQVELLWFGGIGTFVRAASESDLDAGDRANDAVRIRARDLRCRIVAEGANLGMTQRARVEFALHGGRVNTDAIDNSGGVDCSDHEVNIKILLDALTGRSRLTRRGRDVLLAKMGGEVSALVLRDNYLQTQAITVHESRAVEALDRDARLMRALEHQGRLDRALEFLPDDEALAERARLKKGLTRPEIAVLLAYAKLALLEELGKSDLPDDRMLGEDLLRYFPNALSRRFAAAIRRHPLRREIVATSVTNSLVNRMGGSFVNEMKEHTGANAADIARAYAVARDVFGLREIWTRIESLDGRVRAEIQTRMLTATCTLAERAVTWLLAHVAPPLDVTALSRHFRPGAKVIAGRLESLILAAHSERLEKHSLELEAEGVPPPLARGVASLPFMASVFDIVAIAKDAHLDVPHAARVYFAVGARFRLGALREAASAIPGDSPWQRQAVAALIGDLYGHQAGVTREVLRESRARSPESAIAEWAAAHAHAVERADRLIADIARAPALDLPMIAVANRALRGLVLG